MEKHDKKSSCSGSGIMVLALAAPLIACLVSGRDDGSTGDMDINKR